MDLDRFKGLEISKNDVIEYTADSSEIQKGTYYGVFLELIEELPKYVANKNVEVPFVSIAGCKDKNGCPKDFQDISLEDILRLTKIGTSNLGM